MKNIMIFATILLFFFAPFTKAAPSLHLLFHMGMGAEGQFTIGGTLENKGDEDVYQGVIVVTPQDTSCYPQPPIFHTFRTLKAGEKREFKIPVVGPLAGYKINAVLGVDSFGNPIEFFDQTADILAKRLPEQMARCQAKRK
ncbi:hypothetical protein [Aeromonas veronii]|uniref:hypothetical protein n=1 Tax=Aeromonas veronii TaxID=654 RepID=UPI002443D5CA|nr:hypothetical protein [Aeromonas veronii]